MDEGTPPSSPSRDIARQERSLLREASDTLAARASGNGHAKGDRFGAHDERPEQPGRVRGDVHDDPGKGRGGHGRGTGGKGDSRSAPLHESHGWQGRGGDKGKGAAKGKGKGKGKGRGDAPEPDPELRQYLRRYW